jgi:hypothetical protein
MADTAHKSMGHAFPDTQFGIDASGDRALKVTARIVEQNFVIADMDAYRWQSSQVSVEWRGQWVLRVGVTQIGTNQPFNLCSDKIWVSLRPGLEPFTCERQVGDRRKDRRSHRNLSAKRGGKRQNH